MVSKRPAIPVSIENQVLFNSDHTCCICHAKGKHVQIHHIDSVASNNEIDNLAVLCLDCHSRVTGPAGLGKSYKTGEVRKYKRSWDKQIRDLRHLHRPQITNKKEVLTQIDFMVCEILASEHQSGRAKTLFGVLYELHLWRGNPAIDARIIEGLDHVALLSGISSPGIAVMVSELSWQMCWEFVGPVMIPMSKKASFRVIKCIDVLGTLALFNCGFGHSKNVMTSIVDSTERLFEIGLWYSNRQIVDKVIDNYNIAIPNCYSDETRKLEFAFGRATLRKSIRRFMKLMNDAGKTSWPQRTKLERLLSL